MAIYGLIGLMAQVAAAKPSSFCVDYSAHPADSSLLAHEVCILDPSATIDPATLKQGRATGVRYLGYISLVEANPHAFYYSRFEQAKINTLGENSDWGTRLIDLTDPGWRPFFMSIAREITEKGFGGFFLDTADSVQKLAKIQPEKAAEFTEALVGLVKELRKTYPDCEIVVNRGFEQLDAWSDDINGVLAESVFAAFNPTTKEYYDVSPEGTQWIVSNLNRAKAANLDLYVLDYVSPREIGRAWEVEKQIRNLGAVPFISTPDLQGASSMESEFKRKILVIYGYDPELEEMPQISSPLDSATESVVQATIEWMGYELVYQCIVDGLPKIGEMGEYAGVILDESLVVPLKDELEFANWLNANVQGGRKLLFLGGYPLEDDASIQTAFNNLGIDNGEEWPLPVTKTEIVIHDSEMMDYETKTVANTRDFRNTLSPPGSKIYLRLRDISDEKISKIRLFDAVYTCSWGGALLSPYVAFDSSEETRLFYVNVPKFLAAIWPSSQWPVPDATTRDGLRIFYTHIDGDGFTSTSSVDSETSETICGEVMFEEVLKNLPYPITVSIVEATIAGHLLGQKPAEIPRYVAAARKIFELPNVEPASHSYSHPYIWDMNNIAAEEMLYDSLNMPLKLTARYPKIDMTREIVGSLDYIRKNLTPANKPPVLMLWSGNCRPTPETIAICDAAGVENMNGGDTVICNRFPGLGNVSGKLIAMRGRIQIMASNQNEFIYTDGWKGPYHGGFSQVIETFEQTETPVRLKPVNVYYHFYSADRPAALKALKTIYSWCEQQQLHSMTAAEYAGLVRDSFYTRIFKIGMNRWSMVNSGKMRTMRISNDLGYPDLASSRGITGFHRHDQWTYIQTDGSPRTELVLSKTAPTQPYFQTSDNPIDVHEASPRGLTFTVGSRTAKVTVVQLPPGRELPATINEKPVMVRTDKVGTLSLSLEPESNFDIRY